MLNSYAFVGFGILVIAGSASPSQAQVVVEKTGLMMGSVADYVSSAEAPVVFLTGDAIDLSAAAIMPASDVMPVIADGWMDGFTYSPGEFVSNARMIPWATAAVVGGTLALGFSDWDWGTAKFHFVDEGFFGTDTYNGGMDKLGHAYGTTLLADFFTWRLDRHNVENRSAALTGSIMAWGVMGMVETFDGFSQDYGFSPQDIVANTVGATFSFLRNTVPGMQEKVDFRLEYLPSGYDEGFKPHSDYAGQKYVLALKLAGFEEFRESPLRFFELQAGYYTEGFRDEEAADLDISPTRHPYFALGLNVEQLLLGYQKEDESMATHAIRATLQRVQVPYTYLTYETGAYHY